MTLSQLKAEATRMINEKPELNDEIREIYFLAVSETEEGGSESHECELAYNDMLEVFNGEEL